MIQTIVLDLDGPILDGAFRHYTCYRKILAEHGYHALRLDRYWRMKREGVPLRQQLAATGAATIYEDFRRSWLDMIEQPDLLSLDQVQPGVVKKLLQWRTQGIFLVLATLRRYPERLSGQLANLGLNNLMDQVAVCEHRQGGLGKAQRVRSIVTGTSPNRCLWIGDSEVDVEGARAFGCPIWAVTCGVRSESYLARLSPDFLSRDLPSVSLGCTYAK